MAVHIVTGCRCNEYLHPSPVFPDRYPRDIGIKGLDNKFRISPSSLLMSTNIIYNHVFIARGWFYRLEGVGLTFVEEPTYHTLFYRRERVCTCVWRKEIVYWLVIFFLMYWVIQNIKESNHVSAISLSENNWGGIICVLENISNPNWEKSASHAPLLVTLKLRFIMHKEVFI